MCARSAAIEELVCTSDGDTMDRKAESPSVICDIGSEIGPTVGVWPFPCGYSEIQPLDGCELQKWDTGVVRRLPEDILYYLFMFTRTSNPSESLRTTVKLSHVCKQWRDVIVNAPILWTYISLSWTQKNQTNHARVVESFLHRSQDLSLTLYLTVDLFFTLHVSSWVYALSPHAHRFDKLVVLASSLSLHSALQVISPLAMPRLSQFNLIQMDTPENISSVSLKVQSNAQRAAEHYLLAPESKIPYLDWSIRHFNITFLSLKYIAISFKEFYPILLLSQSTLTHFECYDTCHLDGEKLPLLTLPKLISLHIGYTSGVAAYHLATRLILPNLQLLFLRDLTRCPEPGQAEITSNHSEEDIDALRLLSALCPFTKVTSLSLRGVACFASTFEEVMVPAQLLFQNLESLVIVQCDTQLLHVLFKITVTSPTTDLRKLSKLFITSQNFPLLLEYLQIRAVRGLQRLALLSVNAEMAVLRHFYQQFAVSLKIRGKVHHKVRKEIISKYFHPYLCPLRQPRVSSTPLVL